MRFFYFFKVGKAVSSGVWIIRFLKIFFFWEGCDKICNFCEFFSYVCVRKKGIILNIYIILGFFIIWCLNLYFIIIKIIRVRLERYAWVKFL